MAMVESAITDLRYAARIWRRTPIVTISVTVAVALGIAATTAIFSVMEAVFLRPLPFPASGQLVRFSTTVGTLGRVPEVNSLDARDWRVASTRLQGIGLYDVEAATVRLADDAPPVSATLMLVTVEVLPVLGIRPALGRAPGSDDYHFGAASGIMLGNRFWRANFGGQPSAIGRDIQVGAERHTIVGVLPPEADRFPAGGTDIWMPLTFPPSSFLNQRGSIALSAVGRLDDRTTLASAQDEMATIAARLASAYPETNRDRAVHLERLQEAMAGPIKPMMLLLGLSVAMLLAVACANIANILLAQAHGRTLEFATRGALGASPARIARQLWTETLGLFGIAGALGVATAQPLASWLVAQYPGTLPLADDVQLDGRVLAIAVAATLAAALLAGLPRARPRRDPGAGDGLRGDARTGPTPRHRRITTFFVGTQISVSIVPCAAGSTS